MCFRAHRERMTCQNDSQQFNDMAGSAVPERAHAHACTSHPCASAHPTGPGRDVAADERGSQG